jgi:hypothetical protein
MTHASLGKSPIAQVAAEIEVATALCVGQSSMSLKLAAQSGLTCAPCWKFGEDKTVSYRLYASAVRPIKFE